VNAKQEHLQGSQGEAFLRLVCGVPPDQVVGVEVQPGADLSPILSELNLRGDVFLVKPNWFCPLPAMYTDARALDALLSVLPGHCIVIEGHSGMRNDRSRRPQWRTPEARKWIRQQEEWFLQMTGIRDILEKHGAEYINVTEEVWRGDVVLKKEIAAAVLAHGPTVQNTELYKFIPKRLYEHRGATLISLARVKGGWSLATKNLFGLIPDPLRGRWHGKDDQRLPSSIGDIASIYASLFNVVGWIEAVDSAVYYHDHGQHHTPWGNYDIVENPGLILAGKPLTVLDALVARMLGVDPHTLSYLEAARAHVGPWEPAEAVAFPPQWKERLSGSPTS
jgi:uncharacterized protein (DUF362 family)